METYTQQKKRHSEEINDFKGLFFAFSNEQFNEGMVKIGLKPEELNKIVSIGMGGYILKIEVQYFKDMFNRHDQERKTRLKEQKNLIEALAYELNNHEYCITYDPTDALESLGLTRADVDPKILKKACSMAV